MDKFYGFSGNNSEEYKIESRMFTQWEVDIFNLVFSNRCHSQPTHNGGDLGLKAHRSPFPDNLIYHINLAVWILTILLL